MYLENSITSSRSLLASAANHDRRKTKNMCRNIKPLFNYDPAATNDEITASSLQYVRKVSGFTKPSQLNQEVFESAVTDIAKITRALIDALQTNAPLRNREVDIARARARNRY